MKLLSIVKWPTPALESPALEVSEFDADLVSFAKAMHMTMDAAQGIGLAANQVNVLKRVLTIHIPYANNRYEEEEAEGEQQWWHNQRFTLVNPEIISRHGNVRCLEGCLSFPDVFEYIDRSETIKVKAFDEHGKVLSFDADGLLAICIQHEIDHLDGIVFTKRMSRLKASAIRKKLLKRAKQANIR